MHGNKGRKRKPFSKEWRKKMSESHKGKKGYWLGKKNLAITNENNLNWKGDRVGIKSLHKWLRRRLGTPNLCEHCKRTDKKKYEWANVDHKYRRRIEDFIRLCTSCHRNFDIKNNNWQEKEMVFVMNGDKKISIKDLQKIINLKYRTILGRIIRGWTFQEIITIKAVKGNNQQLRHSAY